jgi:transcriptional regulator
VFDDTAALADLVSRLSDHFESSVGSDWKFDAERAELRAQLAGIIGFHFIPQRIDMKFKLNQKHPAANVLSAADALEAQGRPDASSVAQLMRDRLIRDNLPKETS